MAKFTRALIKTILKKKTNMAATKTTQESILVERTFNATADEVWQAISDPNRMKEWYFDIKEFKPEVGFEFQFYAGDEKKKFLHICKIKEVIIGKKLVYSWRYDYDPGVSVVSFELFPEGEKTRLKLTHLGTNNFSEDHPELATENFVHGWNEIIHTNLKKYLEK
jgi:uncharacterized protein YndB with AHSA1/START domain